MAKNPQKPYTKEGVYGMIKVTSYIPIEFISSEVERSRVNPIKPVW